MNSEKIGNTIAFLRRKSGYTQKDLAEKLGITDKAVSKWERGLGIPDTSILGKLSAILDVDVESILAGNMSHHDLMWDGILVARYAEGIFADTLIYDKHAVDIQLSQMLLVGIRSITIICDKATREYLINRFRYGDHLGVEIRYVIFDSKCEDTLIRNILNESNENGCGAMVIDGLDFIYGKDITKTIRRIMYDVNGSVRMTDYCGRILSLILYPCEEDSGLHYEQKNKEIPFERGIIAFPVQSVNAIMDAAMIIRVIENQIGEELFNLEMIARTRGYIN